MYSWLSLSIFVMILISRIVLFHIKRYKNFRSFLFSIHPRTKSDVGYRLSRAGLAVAYNQSVEFQGPVVSDVAYTTGANTITVTYKAVQALELRNPAGFEVCLSLDSCLHTIEYLMIV